jgi:IS30 family transposase
MYALLKAGYHQSNIANLIRVHKSTVRRGLRRNRGLKDYRPKQAQQTCHLYRHSCFPNG